MKKAISLFLVFLIIFVTFSVAYAEDSTDIRYETIEAAVNEAENTVMNQYAEELMQALNNNDIDNYEQILMEATKQRQIAVDEVYESFDIVSLNTEEEKGIQPLSQSSDLIFENETVRYDSASNAIFYTVEWRWLKNGDQFCDIEDIAGVTISNPTKYYIDKSYAKTFSNAGGQTGYVDDSGNHTPSNSYITKRAEGTSGVMFNVNDLVNNSNQLFFARSGRMTLVVRKKSNVSGTPYVKFLASYEHNFKTLTIQFNATISSAGFDAVTGSLQISYSHVNSRWQRASGGKSYGA